jgi:hypothetical protein
MLKFYNWQFGCTTTPTSSTTSTPTPPISPPSTPHTPCNTPLPHFQIKNPSPPGEKAKKPPIRTTPGKHTKNEKQAAPAPDNRLSTPKRNAPTANDAPGYRKSSTAQSKIATANSPPKWPSRTTNATNINTPEHHPPPDWYNTFEVQKTTIPLHRIKIYPIIS